MTVWQLFGLVVSLTAVSFGGGSTLMAGLERWLVPTGLITPAEFAAGVALGQATPGPLAAFTTAIGRAALGLPGAVAATVGLILISWLVVMLTVRVPKAWFTLPAVKGALASVTPYAGGVVFYLAYKICLAGNLERWVGPALLMLLVAGGRLLKLPTALLMIGAVGLGMLLQGTALAGW